MAPGDPEEGFKVTDRRRREDGDPVGADPGPGAAASAGPDRAREAGPAPHGGAAPDPARSLTGLFVMFASSALIALGESPDPVTGQVQRDLAQAGEAIDILTLLREKTEGNRSAEETQLLEQIIYDLQLRFVRARAGPSGR
jgi:uncharacterized protein DUF1844